MRKTLSKSLRFEILKRDEFTCQYCGGKPPGVVLQVDHVVPVASGGENELDNLVASCYECNAGKKARLLGDVRPVPEVPEGRQEGSETLKKLKAYREYLSRKTEQDEDVMGVLLERWSELSGWNYDGGYGWLPEMKRSLVMILKRLDPQRVLDAMDIAHDRIVGQAGRVDWKRERYFYGVCWNMIKQETPQNEKEKQPCM